MKVKICGVWHDIVECDDHFDSDTHFGQIHYAKGEIKINKDMPDDLKEETLCHEVLHGILVHLGYFDLTQDEKFVCAVSNAIYNTFKLRVEE